ncbi:MAG: hypothetical protein JWQ96_2923 [Segetibacter sp.]|nr:hypothetical protein [Segetibacter sp.]
MTNWIYIVVGLSFLLLAFLLWKEINRLNKSGLIWRILATLFAVTSFACLVLPITYNKTTRVDSVKEAVLLTEGFNSDSLNAFLRTKQKTIPVFTLDGKLLSARKHNATFLADAGFFSKDNLHALHVFGYGLNNEELKELCKQSLVFHPSTERGITSISWQDKIKSGDKLLVQGSYNNTSSPSSKKIALTGFNTTLDSINIPASKIQHFQLTTTPKHAGRSVFFISVTNDEDTLEKGPVPVQVEPAAPVSVLILASSPDFENKFLKNWLAQKGYEVVVRTAISKNKFYKEYLNTNTIHVDRITSTLLDKFDILIADESELATISKPELATIQSHIIRNNKGLIVRADSTAARSAFYAATFPLASSNTTHVEQISLHIFDSSTKLQPLTIESPVFIRAKNGTQPLVTDKQNRVFVNSTLYGSGKIIFITLSNTFSWALAGNQNDYDHLWSELLNKAAGKKVEEETWSTSPTLPRVNEPVKIILQTNSVGVPQAQVEGAAVYLKNNFNLPFKWSGTFWPVKEGWQAGIQLNGNTYYWYAYGNDDWKNVHATNKIESTSRQQSLVNTTEDKKISTTQKVEFPKIYFFLLLLFCCGYLWLESKLQQ